MCLDWQLVPDIYTQALELVWPVRDRGWNTEEWRAVAQLPSLQKEK